MLEDIEFTWWELLKYKNIEGIFVHDIIKRLKQNALNFLKML